MSDPIDTSTAAKRKTWDSLEPDQQYFVLRVLEDKFVALAAERDTLAQRVQELEDTILGAGGWDARCKQAESALATLEAEHQRLKETVDSILHDHAKYLQLRLPEMQLDRVKRLFEALRVPAPAPETKNRVRPEFGATEDGEGWVQPAETDK